MTQGEILAALDTEYVKALIHESEQVQSGVDRSQNALYTSSGVIFPILTGLFVLAGREKTTSGISFDILALLFIVTVSLGGMWSQYLWMELLRYTSYKHAVLLPRLYAATGQHQSLNFLQTAGRQTLVARLPILLFNVGCFAVLIIAHVAFVAHLAASLQIISVVFIVAVVVSTLAVFKEAESVGVAIVWLAGGGLC